MDTLIVSVYESPHCVFEVMRSPQGRDSDRGVCPEMAGSWAYIFHGNVSKEIELSLIGMTPVLFHSLQHW